MITLPKERLMIETYQTRPNTIKALKWNGENFQEMQSMCPWVKRLEFEKDTLRADNTLIFLNQYLVKKNGRFFCMTRDQILEDYEPTTFHNPNQIDMMDTYL